MHEFQSAAHAIAQEWEVAWNTHDMARMASLLTSDADFVNVLGKHWKGAAEIEGAHAAMHRTQFHKSIWQNKELGAQLLSPGLGLVHLSWALQGDYDPDGTPRQPRTGLFSWLLSKVSGRWLIRAAHNTNVAVLPSAPTRGA